MKKALIIFNNKNTKTRKFGEEIAAFLLIRGLAAELIPINNFKPEKLRDADYLLLSSWEKNSIFSTSHPNNEWTAFVNQLPTLDGIKTALFTTYKLFSGSILRSMKKYLSGKTNKLEFAIKSKDGSLSISDKMTLNEFLDK